MAAAVSKSISPVDNECKHYKQSFPRLAQMHDAARANKTLSYEFNRLITSIQLHCSDLQAGPRNNCLPCPPAILFTTRRPNPQTMQRAPPPLPPLLQRNHDKCPRRAPQAAIRSHMRMDVIWRLFVAANGAMIAPLILSHRLASYLRWSCHHLSIRACMRAANVGAEKEQTVRNSSANFWLNCWTVNYLACPLAKCILTLYGASGSDSIGHGGTCPHLYRWVEEQQTRNWPNCTGNHESAHQND